MLSTIKRAALALVPLAVLAATVAPKIRLFP